MLLMHNEEPDMPLRKQHYKHTSKPERKKKLKTSGFPIFLALGVLSSTLIYVLKKWFIYSIRIKQRPQFEFEKKTKSTLL